MNNRLPLVLILSLLAAPAIAATGDEAEQVVPEELSAQAEEDEDGGDAGTDDVTVAEGVEDEEDDEGRDGVDWPFGWSISTGISSSAGNVFRQDLPIEERDESVLNSWSFGVSKEFVDGFSGSIGWGFSKYLTTSGGMNLQREARIRDLSIGLSYGPIYRIPRADISISASLGATVPLSRMSRTSTLRTRLAPGLSFSRSFGNLRLSYRLGGSKSFHRFTSAVLDPTDVDIIRREGGAEDISRNEVATAGVNTEWSISHGLSLSYQWFDGFSTSLSWGYGKSWGYAVNDCDEYSAEAAVCGRRIPRDSMTGSISASYNFLDNYSVSLGASTAQRPKTGDNRRFNFPFWDIQTPGLFYTQLGVDFGVSF